MTLLLVILGVVALGCIFFGWLGVMAAVQAGQSDERREW